MKFPTYKEIDEKVAKEALDTVEYNGKTLREWIEIISATELDTNCISRQAAVDAIDEISNEVADGYGFDYAKWREYFCELPPAEPQRIRAKWIATTSLQEGQITWRDYKCSNCSHHRSKPMNFCEVCGRKMER